jgi:hypothetical protein
MPQNGNRFIVLWMMIAIVSVIVAVIGVRQIIVIERQAAFTLSNQVQDDADKALAEALRIHEATVHPDVAQRLEALERRMNILEISVAEHHAADAAREKLREQQAKGMVK